MDERATIDLERRLAESEARHRLLVEGWAQAVWETDADGLVTADSPSWRAYTGQTLEEWLGYGWVDAIHPDDRAYAERQWQEATAAHRVVDAEFRLRSPDGGWRWTNVRAAPVSDAAGSIEKWVGVNIDIDERKRAEAALRESEGRLHLALEATELAVYEWELETDRLTTNERFRELVGIEPGEPIIGARVMEHCVHPDDRTRVDPDLARAMDSASNGKFVFEHRLSRLGPLGNPWVLSHGQVYFAGADDARRPARVFGTLQDITSRRLAEIAAHESDERQAFLLKLSDALRAEPGADAVAYRALQMLFDHLGLDRCYITDYRPADDEAHFPYQIGNDTVPPLPAKVRLSDFPDAYEQVLDRTFVVEDDFERRGLSEAERVNSKALGMRAMVASTVRRGEKRPLSSMAVVSSRPRRWSPNEIAVVEEAAERTWAAIERTRAEAALRESEERQAFLLRLSDELRAVDDPEAIGALSTRMVAGHMRVDRCYIAQLPRGEGRGRIGSEFRAEGLAPLAGEYRFEDFPEGMKRLETGPLIIRDVMDDDSLSDADKQAIGRLMGLHGMLAAVLRKGEGNYFWCLTAATTEPRDWTGGELKLLEDVAERTWAAVERARAEAALRRSEERFRQFARASSAGLWIREAETLAMEFVSPSVGTIYGIEADALLGDVKRWAAMIVPEDREAAIEHLKAARVGETAVHEFRIQRPSDGAFRWIRNTDFSLRDGGDIPRIGGIAEDVTEARLATEHSAVLLAELQHRVRNIMALLRSITARTAERAESVPEYRDLMMGRLLAFARVQALLTRTANVSVGIASIVHDEVSVQASHAGQYVIDGSDVALSPKAAEVLTLAIHELATNAVKYGALSAADGRVTVRWSTFETRGGAWLAFDWTEDGAPVRPAPTPDAPRRRGFGSELIEGRIPYELRGRGQVAIEPGGARCHLESPLQGGASILETGAPRRATVFGGAIDMTGEPDLTGRRILVVEDDYYLATDTARALRGAGAEVLGPCATEEDARVELTEQRPDAVVVDINLGPGPSFKLAEALKDNGIPFVFTTGYDAEAIPAAFAGVERLQKPLQLRQIVGAVARLTTIA